jgi:hypothetical protein
MRKKFSIGVACCLSVFLTYSCLDPYNPPASTDNVNYLVVDGFLNATTKSCTIKLTRSIPINSTDPIVGETAAQVSLEDENGSTFPLPETVRGEYSAVNLAVDNTKKYRLRITTSDANEYTSDLIAVLTTPPIDDITWGVERLGVPIYVSTHDPANNTHYYMWKYKETWTYNAAFDSYLRMQDGEVVLREESIYRCWLSNASNTILISSSNRLDQDLISQFTLTTIPWENQRLGSKYSILVEQHALSRDGYDYLQQLKKNTENLGTLFDALPSRISGNIRCVTDPKQFVLGHFNANEIQTKRIFFTNTQINRPTGTSFVSGYEECREDTIRLGRRIGGTQSPVRYWYQGITVIGHYVAETSCVDCRYRGGTTVEPDFWE